MADQANHLSDDVSLGAPDAPMALLPTGLPIGSSPDDLETGRMDPPSPVRAWFGVAILLVFSLFSYLDRQIIALLVDPIKADLGLTDSQLGLLQGLAFALLYSVAGLPIGWAVDRYPRRIVIFLGMVTWSASSAACGLAHNFWQMFVARTVVGVGEASLSPTAVSLIGDLFPRDKMATPMGVFSTGFYLGGGAALVIGGWIASLFAGREVVAFPLIGDVAPWQATFLVAGLPGILVALLAFAISDPRPAPAHLQAHRTPAEQRHLLPFMREHRRVIGFAFSAFGLSALVGYAITSWTPAFFMRTLGWSAAEVGATFGTVIALSGAAGAVGGGMLMDRLFRAGHKDAIFLLTGIVSLIAAPVLVGAYFMPWPMATMALLCLGLTFLGVIAAGSFTSWQVIAPPSLRGQLTAAFVLVGAIVGAGLGPLSVGLLTDYLFGDPRMVGYSIAIVVGFALPTMGVLLLSGRGALRDHPEFD